MYAKAGLEGEELREVHNEIKGINGIGSKITSLFLRDVATFYNVYPRDNRTLLQPIDIWVRRIVKKLGGPVTEPSEQNLKVDEKARNWIVNESSKESVCPEKVNQGMWYFASQIAGSYYRLKKSIEHEDFKNKFLAQHKQTLERAAKATASLLF
jgi:hypothetical protein